ncbi:calmodulin-binding transcription activator 5-like isoform X3 [Arachis hypogaea]|uniref:calmodulin-binding transcription activator 5-like isoform X3 n=1 Tax=Arachis hypogaea TaxID=3818 RepID=UPI003B21672E
MKLEMYLFVRRPGKFMDTVSIDFCHRLRWSRVLRLEHIVLVHYRETQESQGSPVTLVNSHSSSASDQPWLSEELDSGTNTAYASGSIRIDLTEFCSRKGRK